ncbi:MULTISPECIES: VIT family protein [Leuconostoc]|uniref:VIT family protein n=1 Tax=Leuconostoc gasicomitatum TaxID=115778 RepID=A0A9Q3SU77_9LACO|nr:MULTISPECIES: VIT family protein [Leuconostoc]MBR2276891.1 VIT family protein [Leuconostoc sp.]MBZ5946544.1 VIT family protein [Leuconostoc gasicomitatum]MBZ5949307.1 VIT family protein [Leuconostoc gasicomitatum]MBZ5951206.1 VIT family protein [Leuconostoc gasicomitatum]MBZ5955446.1 VIT family protein [Leuconostoc gasicomitatum]
MDKQSLMQRNNLIRAAVMGANDGILSVSGIVLGVAGATSHTGTILLAGFAGMLAGTVSMAMGEYVSVSSQHDAQEKVRRVQTEALATNYDDEFSYVEDKYVADGISPHLAQQATEEMMTKDALTTTVRERYGFSLDHELSAGGAALASLISFPIGSILPMVAISLMPRDMREVATFIAVIVALAITGYAAASLNGANKKRVALRNVVAGIFTMIVTYAIGSLFR